MGNLLFLLFGIMFKTMINLDSLVEYVRGVASQNLGMQLSPKPATQIAQDILTYTIITFFIFANIVFYMSLIVDAWRNILRALHEGDNLTFGEAIAKKNNQQMERW